MYSIVKKVKYLGGYRLELTFESGEKGVVDLSEFPERKGVFNRFSDIEYFRQVTVNGDFGVIVWPGGEDIAPETIYSMATGKSIKDILSHNGISV